MSIEEKIETGFRQIDEQLNDISEMISELSAKTNKSLKKSNDIIESLIGSAGLSDDCELMIYKEYRKPPMIIRDGKIIGDPETRSFSVQWDEECGTKITIGLTVK